MKKRRYIGMIAFIILIYTLDISFDIFSAFLWLLGFILYILIIAMVG